VASAESDGATELWNVTTQTQTGAALTVQGSAGVSALAFSPAADALATGNGNGSIQLWNPAGFHQPSAPLVLGSVGAAAAGAGHTPAAFSASSGLLATSNGHGTVRVWNVTARRAVGLPMGSYHTVTGLALSPDGKTLAVAGSGVQLWQTATGQRIGTTLPSAGNGRYRAVAFSPDGTMLATLGADGTARIWDVATQQEIGAPMTADAQPVYAVAFSPGGSMLATTGGDGSVRLWDVATQQEIGTPMTAGIQPVYAAAFGPGGSTLATAGGDGAARTWDVAFPANLLQAACGIANVSLTRQQWADYAGSQPFQQVCPAG
jgi:WD40 repeat protein